MLVSKLKPALLITIMCLSAPAYPWTLVSTSLPPYVMEGEIQGYSVDLVQHIAQEMEQQLELKIIPWARAQQMVQQRSDLLITPITRTEYREELYDWLLPIKPYRLWFVTNDPGIDINNLDVIRKHQICALRQSPAAKTVNDLELPNFTFLNDDQKCLQLLGMGRVKILLAHGRDQAKWSFAMAGYDPASLKFGYSINGGVLYLASSKGMFNEAQKRKITELYNEAVNSGYFQTLTDRYTDPPRSLYQK